ncbi:hypothetical protein CANCADRAFT_45223 [Tortispora caseinolytica NRRL Y-17796]|uniref:Peroxisome assembly protein 22 n=1 Tax=Tortispora caseinolytica NRRL Y-17796 TaxID=767744 RepID=A0A1E4TAC5_9ASCO|nr:hypothetical protein CANCADRAFT_45223 [Tortispora caseinolytica NRRL Y-17796]
MERARHRRNLKVAGFGAVVGAAIVATSLAALAYSGYKLWTAKSGDQQPSSDSDKPQPKPKPKRASSLKKKAIVVVNPTANDSGDLDALLDSVIRDKNLVIVFKSVKPESTPEPGSAAASIDSTGSATPDMFRLYSPLVHSLSQIIPCDSYEGMTHVIRHLGPEFDAVLIPKDLTDLYDSVQPFVKSLSYISTDTVTSLF